MCQHNSSARVLIFIRRRVVKVFVGGMVPVWRHDICKHHIMVVGRDSEKSLEPMAVGGCQRYVSCGLAMHWRGCLQPQVLRHMVVAFSVHPKGQYTGCRRIAACLGSLIYDPHDHSPMDWFILRRAPGLGVLVCVHWYVYWRLWAV